MAEATNRSVLHVNVVSATSQVWEGDAVQVVARTTEGEIGILPGHTPVLASLAVGEVRVKTVEGRTVTAQAEDGFLSVANDLVTVLAGEATLSE